MPTIEPTLSALTETIARQAAGKKGFGKSILLELGDEGAIRIDGTGDKVVVSNDGAPADTSIGMSPETMVKLMTGKLSPQYAFMTGKLSLKGEMSLALELAKFI